MTVNYIIHDQEFFGVIKLKTGETILGSMIATEEDTNPGKTIFYIINLNSIYYFREVTCI